MRHFIDFQSFLSAFLIDRSMGCIPKNMIWFFSPGTTSLIMPGSVTCRNCVDSYLFSFFKRSAQYYTKQKSIPILNSEKVKEPSCCVLRAIHEGHAFPFESMAFISVMYQIINCYSACLTAHAHHLNRFKAASSFKLYLFALQLIVYLHHFRECPSSIKT